METQLAQTDITFEKDRIYPVELYPIPKVINVRYEKRHNRIHIFQDKGDYILLENHWLIIDDGKITYSPYSSASIQIIPKQEAEKAGGIEIVIDKFFGDKK